MLENFDPIRYAIINEKNPREIVMLRGSGCQWRRCRFCDYHLDSSMDQEANDVLNAAVLAQVTGCHHKLEVINSGSFIDLSAATMDAILAICQEKAITEVHFECHWLHRASIAALKERFGRYHITVKVKIGVETFDPLFRESYLDKGIGSADACAIAAYFDEVCLLQGIPGQTVASMLWDITTGLAHFERVCINIMQVNGKPIKPDPAVIAAFTQEILPIYATDPRVDILMENTAFGVGGVTTHDE